MILIAAFTAVMGLNALLYNSIRSSLKELKADLCGKQNITACDAIRGDCEKLRDEEKGRLSADVKKTTGEFERHSHTTLPADSKVIR